MGDVVAQGGTSAAGESRGGRAQLTSGNTWLELRDCWAWPEGRNGDSNGMGTGRGLCPKLWPHGRPGAALGGTKVAAAPHPGVVSRPPPLCSQIQPFPKLSLSTSASPQPLSSTSTPGVLLGCPEDRDRLQAGTPQPPPPAAGVKIKLIPSLPPRALSDGSIIPVNPCQASLPCLGARLGAGGLLGPPWSPGNRGSPPRSGGKRGPTRSGKREKEAALVAGTWGSVGCRMGCGHPKSTVPPAGQTPPIGRGAVVPPSHPTA